MKLFLKGLFGGGSWGIYLVFLTVIGGGYLRMKHAESKVDKLEIEIQQKDEALASKDNVIASQARSQARRTVAQQELDGVEDEIAKQPESFECVRSPSIDTALGFLREQSANDTNDSGK